MHSFMKSIGFAQIKNKKQMDVFVSDVVSSYTEKFFVQVDADTILMQINKDYGSSFGISVIGELDDDDCLNVEYCYPYLKGNIPIDEEEIQIEKHADKEAYAGICEDINIGVSLIFYIHNIIDYVRRKVSPQFYQFPNQVCLSGLAQSATILLEINKDEKQVANEKNRNTNRNNLLAAARAGDAEAIENLTLEDMDTYTMISRRSKNEDIFTIVDSYFMPFGIDSDQYSVLGNILDVKKEQNTATKEWIYIMLIECNNIQIHICVNEQDITGKPEVGRRFRGVIWLQGRVIFNTPIK